MSKRVTKGRAPVVLQDPATARREHAAEHARGWAQAVLPCDAGAGRRATLEVLSGCGRRLLILPRLGEKEVS
jgi:hypothetical protein